MVITTVSLHSIESEPWHWVGLSSTSSVSAICEGKNLRQQSQLEIGIIHLAHTQKFPKN